MGTILFRLLPWSQSGWVLCGTHDGCEMRDTGMEPVEATQMPSNPHVWTFY
jgi:hypothetical protein